MVHSRTGILAALWLTLPLTALASTYEVGPGQAYNTLGDVPWENLAAGDTVLIHARTVGGGEWLASPAAGEEGSCDG